ncbi:hypothetical protein TRICI_004666 [Trichomonascus ciferrii]|uniref:Trafficking protein particle complex II-specific subunit 65 IgD3 domain-containing protein n=1 Tax=Trichomonascus ciferrii TaxID=44093 RepID=A0A642V592_9ASCO|nr:hypothetical protein TRICI_004666 [Trichomonascus ciferrii]
MATRIGPNATDILSSGVLSIHVPERGEFDGDANEVKERSILFYDEEVPLYIKLELEEDFSSVLELVAIAIEVKVVGQVPSSQQGPNQKGVEQTSVMHSQIVTHENLIRKATNVAIWKVNVPVDHPRTRLISPHAMIDAVVNITHEMTDGLEASKQSEDTSFYLDEFRPVQEINLFEALGHDANLNQLHSNLSASRVATSENNSPKPLPKEPPQQGEDDYPTNYEKLTKLAAAVKLPVYPALNLRLRCTKATGIQDNLVAVLSLSSSDNAKVDVLVKSVKFDLVGGTSTPLGPRDFPLPLSPGEDCMLSYTLSHSDVFLLTQEQAGSRVKPVSIVVESIPVLYENEGPVITTKWDTTVDFDISSVPPKESATASTAVLTQPPPPPPPPPPSHSPLTGMGITAPTPSFKKLAKLGRTSSSSSVPTLNRTSTSTKLQQLSGLTLSFSGPSAVKVSETFRWKIFAVNKSQAVRHLALYVHPSDKMEKNLPKNTDLYPVIDRTSLRRMYQASSLGSVGIICLANDIRLGPLYPQACFETEINLLALSAGVHSLEGLTIVDQATGDSFDCGRLLEVVVNDN